MLAKKYILNNKKIFTALKFKGEKLKTGTFLISYFANRLDISNNRFGIIISAKTIAKAHDRNQVKRKLRAILFDFKDVSFNKQFLDMAIVVFKNPQISDYQKLIKDLNRLFYEKN